MTEEIESSKIHSETSSTVCYVQPSEFILLIDVLRCKLKRLIKVNFVWVMTANSVEVHPEVYLHTT